MYDFFLQKFGKNIAVVLITIWYLLLIYLLLFSFNAEDGRFRYAIW
jgi:hypothetical protein